jgi:hypothetical protein
MKQGKEERVFLDGSNLFIEGQRLSSFLRRGATAVTVTQHTEFDFDFRLDLRRLKSFLGSDLGTSRPLLVGSHSENSDSLFASAHHCGFDTIVYERDTRNREKKVDTTIVMHMLLAALDGTPEKTRLILVAGDSDYAPLVLELRRRKFEVEVVFWGHASHELKEAATRFVPLDGVIDFLRYHPTYPATSVA